MSSLEKIAGARGFLFCFVLLRPRTTMNKFNFCLEQKKTLCIFVINLDSVSHFKLILIKVIYALEGPSE